MRITQNRAEVMFKEKGQWLGSPERMAKALRSGEGALDQVSRVMQAAIEKQKSHVGSEDSRHESHVKRVRVYPYSLTIR